MWRELMISTAITTTLYNSIIPSILLTFFAVYNFRILKPNGLSGVCSNQYHPYNVITMSAIRDLPT